MYFNSLSSIARTVICATRRVALAAMAVSAVTFGSGCSLLSDNLDKAAKGAGKVVSYYCENITIPEIREEVRAAVNKHAAPHSVAIECVDDLGREVGPELKSLEPASVAVPTAYKTEAAAARELLARLPIVIVDRYRPNGKPKRPASLS